MLIHNFTPLKYAHLMNDSIVNKKRLKYTNYKFLMNYVYKVS